jgi:hypothetical protein
LPYFQSSEACDRWSRLVEIANWQVFLARQLVADQPLPWQKAQARLTPGRVRRGLALIFSQIGTPPSRPKRAESHGLATGRLRQRPERYKPTKRTKKKVKST